MINKLGLQPDQAQTILGAEGILSARAEVVKASSAWTGRRSIEEQATVVKSYAPLAQSGVEQLIRAVEERRFNDPATHKALEALRELHQALGDLLNVAERGASDSSVWVAVERHKETFTGAVRDGAKVMVAAPVLALGTAYVLQLLSGFPVTGEMLSILAAGGVIGEGLKKLQNAKTSS